MGQYDAAFNCSTGNFRFCCGTCHYRFCCEHRGRRLEQRRCTNLQSPGWARAPPPPPPRRGAAAARGREGGEGGEEGEGEREEEGEGDGGGGAGSGTPYVVCGVVSLVLAVAVAARAVLGRGGSGRGEPGQDDGGRALMDVLRHQAGGGRPERRSSGVLPPPPPDNGPARPPKTLYSTVKACKGSWGGAIGDTGPHSYVHLGMGTPEHRAATLDWRGPRSGSLSCSRSFHNLSHPPPPYEGPAPPELGRCTSLRRLADRDPDDPWGSYWAPAWAPPPRSALPLAPPTPRGGPAPRRVLSQELLLAGGGWGGTMPRARGGAGRRDPAPSPRPPAHATSHSSLAGGVARPGGSSPSPPAPPPGPAPPPPPPPPPVGSGPAHPPRRLQRQSTAELQLLPGPPPHGHHLRTGSRTEVTV
ncbi:protein shisa-7-like [Neopsephotus bourkii]|uniref:protein shisa-7-like n=1 Tax=Neopsephotus bourkii TaxID=309878 RepID=UPI002AA4FDBD|nr:protein shisa-7-like [Neopsephotus bourkii]